MLLELLKGSSNEVRRKWIDFTILKTIMIPWTEGGEKDMNL